MGKNIDQLPEPDWRNVTKKLVKIEKPCVVELSALMDCMKTSTDVDNGCVRERIALQACSQKMGGTAFGGQRGTIFKQMQRLSKSWKRFGY